MGRQSIPFTILKIDQNVEKKAFFFLHYLSELRKTKLFDIVNNEMRGEKELKKNNLGTNFKIGKKLYRKAVSPYTV